MNDILASLTVDNWFMIVVGLLLSVGAIAFFRTRRPAKEFRDFDPVAQLKQFFTQTRAAAEQVARERGWDDETRSSSEAQVYGFLTKGVLNACKAGRIVDPELDEHTQASLRLTEYPLLSTASAVFARLSSMGIVPPGYRTDERMPIEFQQDMAERLHDAPIREAMGLLAFRIDHLKRSREGSDGTREEGFLGTSFARLCAAADLHTSGSELEAAKLASDLRVSDLAVPNALLLPLTSACRMLRHVRADAEVNGSLSLVEDDAILREFAVSAWATVFRALRERGVGERTLQVFTQGAARLEEIIAEGRAVPDAHAFLMDRLSHYGSSFDANVSCAAATLVGFQKGAEPLDTVPKMEDAFRDVARIAESLRRQEIADPVQRCLEQFSRLAESEGSARDSVPTQDATERALAVEFFETCMYESALEERLRQIYHSPTEVAAAKRRILAMKGTTGT